MKTKIINKKLAIKKTTIASLLELELMQVKGGDGIPTQDTTGLTVPPGCPVTDPRLTCQP